MDSTEGRPQAAFAFLAFSARLAAAAFREPSLIDPSEQRIAENEAIFRDSNRRLDERYHELGIEAERIPFLCECGNERCTHVLTLTPEEYAEIRAHAAYFLIVPGHQILASEKIVCKADGYVVVEKSSAVLAVVQQIEGSLFKQ